MPTVFILLAVNIIILLTNIILLYTFYGKYLENTGINTFTKGKRFLHIFISYFISSIVYGILNLAKPYINLEFITKYLDYSYIAFFISVISCYISLYILLSKEKGIEKEEAKTIANNTIGSAFGLTLLIGVIIYLILFSIL